MTISLSPEHTAVLREFAAAETGGKISRAVAVLIETSPVTKSRLKARKRSGLT